MPPNVLGLERPMRDTETSPIQSMRRCTELMVIADPCRARDGRPLRGYAESDKEAERGTRQIRFPSTTEPSIMVTAPEIQSSCGLGNRLLGKARERKHPHHEHHGKMSLHESHLD